MNSTQMTFSPRDLLRRPDVFFALGVITIIVVLIMPIPPIMMDSLLAISIIFSVMILMISLFIHTPLEFSTFPTILLLATMMRLSLNLASTRLILANGHQGSSSAGHVIEAFGNFVMQGNFVIGIIVFGILVIVNFVVITKGSGRIAEVAARFSLDAMPGKQMAIDADLSAGLIDEETAKARRQSLEEESTFFGSMDGASKFVRGDAIAGILITMINVIGGIIIGVGQNGLALGEAATTYTILTVGDGLVSQIPALIVSTSAGILVSKSGVSGSAEKVLIKQFSEYPVAFIMAAVVMLVMGLLPGMPMLPFTILSAISGYVAYRLIQGQKISDQIEATTQAEKLEEEKSSEEELSLTEVLRLDPLKIEVGLSLVPLIQSESKDNNLPVQVQALRNQLAQELGFIIPPVRMVDNVRLDNNSYVLKLKEIEAGRGEIYPGRYMALAPTDDSDVKVPGITAKEPAYGLPVTWVELDMRDELQMQGFTVIDAASVLSTHLNEILKSNLSELLTYESVQALLKALNEEQQKLISDIVPDHISVSGIQRVLQSLLAERISIRDLPTILEAIAEIAPATRSIRMISEHVRSRMARQICDMLQSENGYIPLISLSPEWEKNFAESIVGDGDDRHLAMAPSLLHSFVEKVNQAMNDAAQRGETPALMTSANNRFFIRSIIERFREATFVVSQSEIYPKAKLKTMSVIS